jgi:hypothetical protein
VEEVERIAKEVKGQEKEQPIAPIASGGSGRIATEAEGQEKEQLIAPVAS